MPILFIGGFITFLISFGARSPLPWREVGGEAKLNHRAHTLANPISLDFLHRLAKVNLIQARQ